MKKALVILAFAVAAMLGVLLAGCGGSSSGGGSDLSDSEFVGTWQAVSMSIGDEEEPYTEECILTLNDDGTGTISDGSEVTEFNWELTDEGFKTSGDMKMKFTGDGTAIHGKILGANLNFEKQ